MQTSDWREALHTSYEQLHAYLLTYTPQIIGALILLIIGWVVAWVLSRFTLSLVRFGSSLWSKLALRVFKTPVKEVKSSHAKIVSRTVFWLIMLFFIAAATSNLGLDFFATWLRELLGYVPRILAGLVIIVGGYFLGSIASVMAQAGAESAGFKRTHLLGDMIKLAVIFTALVVGVEQLGVNLQFVTTLVIVLSGVLTLGVSIAFGLGSRDLVANLLGARQAREHLKLNERIRFKDYEGILVQITATMLVIEGDNGRIVLPAKICFEDAATVSSGAKQRSSGTPSS